jgi:hypothetical protein
MVDLETASHLRRLERNHGRNVLQDVLDLFSLIPRELVDRDVGGVDVDGAAPGDET